MSEQRPPEALQRWADLLQHIDMRFLGGLSNVALTAEEARQFHTCVKYAIARKHFIVEEFAYRLTQDALAKNEPLTRGHLLIAGFCGNIGLFIHDHVCRTTGRPGGSLFSLQDGDHGLLPGDDDRLEIQVIASVCDRIYAALGGGIRLGHHRMTKGRKP